ncbi:hypothetical protein N7474_009889 [Penicillium riverlandense]|uniref:uncharacterized protein n=1 Tax=Penicillium riverlandense TaxID=1903569 RepID=UPI0025484E7E|nr:uncharacterized protein N7474_009889 [Penicillium riverlandense]KAJ5808620.1 hypothetical protein N7474_009889 [Penicillium riverlandense]
MSKEKKEELVPSLVTEFRELVSHTVIKPSLLQVLEQRLDQLVHEVGWDLDFCFKILGDQSHQDPLVERQVTADEPPLLCKGQALGIRREDVLEKLVFVLLTMPTKQSFQLRSSPFDPSLSFPLFHHLEATRWHDILIKCPQGPVIHRLIIHQSHELAELCAPFGPCLLGRRRAP